MLFKTYKLQGTLYIYYSFSMIIYMMKKKINKFVNSSLYWLLMNTDLNTDKIAVNVRTKDFVLSFCFFAIYNPLKLSQLILFLKTLSNSRLTSTKNKSFLANVPTK